MSNNKNDLIEQIRIYLDIFYIYIYRMQLKRCPGNKVSDSTHNLEQNMKGKVLSNSAPCSVCLSACVFNKQIL